MREIRKHINILVYDNNDIELRSWREGDHDVTREPYDDLKSAFKDAQEWMEANDEKA